ncbi:cytochrome ubiquinol oxidase subunit I [Symbiobacterium thermophilum]|nr:cytochrome ubiquinol oxidase subunit I [Symbiobacterium thermophilum]
MSHLDAARFQMAYSLFFHMIFAALGVGMPALLATADYLHLRTRDRDYERLAKTWARATAVLFAIGAVSGTGIAFELGLLWPEFMHFAGSTVGPAFTLEGYAFFTEAIFIGLYLYGRERMRPVAHWLTAVAVAVSGAASSFLVTAANAWQQNPVGVDLLQSNPEAMNPWTVFVNPHWPVMAVHSTIACYAATGFAVAGVYAWGMLRGRGDPLRQKALRIALAMGLIAAVTMPLTGDLSAKVVARHQPEKLAAMEALFVTQARAPLLIGGLPNPEEGTVCCAVAVPGLLSFLAYGRLDAEVAGLDRVPRQEWPNVPLVHISFQLMVGAGIAMVLVGLYYAWVRWRRPEQVPRDRRLLWLLVLSSPLGYLALEAGWIVSETGRQPWTIWKVMLTADAVTPSGSTMALSMAGFTALYAALAAALVLLLNRLRHE